MAYSMHPVYRRLAFSGDRPFRPAPPQVSSSLLKPL